MSLNDKLEEIRQKPEHIRIRYVWGAVILSMIFIIFIWIFSLGKNNKDIPSQNNNLMPDLKKSLEEIPQSTPSLDDSSEQLEGEGALNGDIPANTLQENSINPETNNLNP